jgi:hypothetical protein
METFYPFLYEEKEKDKEKKENNLLPLYIEMDPPDPIKNPEEPYKEDKKQIIIDLF